MKATYDDINSFIINVAVNLGIPSEQIIKNLAISHENITNTAITSDDEGAGPKKKDSLHERLSQNPNKIGLEICDKKGICWRNLPQILAHANAYIDNYPDIPIPGEGKLGIRSLSNDEQQRLLKALGNKDHHCSFK